jgi:hypothetical protein
MCSSKPPKPDPLIGQAAKQQADIAQQQLDVAKAQLDWEKERARVRDANEFDSQERKDRMAAEAGADVARGYLRARDSSLRGLERLGVNPNSGKFQALAHEMNLGFAKDTAGAMNKARRETELQGLAMRQGAAQFGRSMPTTGIAIDAAALNAGNAATGNLATKAGLHNAGMNAAQNWFDGALSGNSSAGNLMLNQYQGQLNAWQQQQQNKAAGLAGLGNLAPVHSAVLT